MLAEEDDPLTAEGDEDALLPVVAPLLALLDCPVARFFRLATLVCVAGAPLLPDLEAPLLADDETAAPLLVGADFSTVAARFPLVLTPPAAPTPVPEATPFVFEAETPVPTAAPSMKLTTKQTTRKMAMSFIF